MKGIVFTYLEDFVSERQGLEAWDDLLENTPLRTEDGIFVAPGNYPDEDFMTLVQATSKKARMPGDDFVFALGEFVLSKFHADYPEFFEEVSTAKEFLLTVDDIIHVEVKKLYPDVVLPAFRYEDRAPDALTMIYKSPRRLCPLARGLISGVGKHFKEQISISETECTRRGGRECRFDLTFR